MKSWMAAAMVACFVGVPWAGAQTRPAAKRQRLENLPDAPLFFVHNAAGEIHYAYGVAQGGKKHVVFDGKAQADFDSLGSPDTLTVIMSSDGKHLAYLAESNGKSYLVHDGKQGTAYDGVGLPVFNTDGSRLAFSISKGGKFAMIVDDKELGTYDDFADWKFSPDGKHFAFVGLKEGKRTVVSDGKVAATYDTISGLAWSPDSARLAFVAEKDKQQFVVTDGKPEASYPKAGPPVFSPDSRHVAYWVEEKDGAHLVTDGKKGEVLGEHLSTPTYSPDGQQLVINAQLGDRWHTAGPIVGVEYVAMGRGVFSPDSKNFMQAVSLVKGKWSTTYNGGAAGPNFDGVSDVTFAADSRLVVFKAVNGKQRRWVVGGKPEQLYDDVSPIALAPGRHYGYAGDKAGKRELVMDGKVVSPEDDVLAGPNFLEGLAYQYLARVVEGGKPALYRVTQP